MQDELLMREWTRIHDDFVAGLHSRRDRPAGSPQTQDLSFDMIEPAYRRQNRAQPRKPRAGLSPAAQASLRGLAASVVTALLWMSLMTLAVPASGLGSVTVEPVATHDPVLA